MVSFQCPPTKYSFELFREYTKASRFAKQARGLSRSNIELAWRLSALMSKDGSIPGREVERKGN